MGGGGLGVGGGPPGPAPGSATEYDAKAHQRGFLWIVSRTEFGPWTQKYIYI